MKKRIHLWLYRLGIWLVRTFADQHASLPDIEQSASLPATHLHRLAIEHPTSPPERPDHVIAQNAARLAQEIFVDVPGASLASVHDRVVKALSRLHPGEDVTELAKHALDEMRRNGIV